MASDDGPLSMGGLAGKVGQTDLSAVAADDFLASAAGITAEKGPLSNYIDASAPKKEEGDAGQFGGVPVGLGGAGDTGNLGRSMGGQLPELKSGGANAKAKAVKR